MRQCQEEAKQGYKEFKAVVGRLVIRLRDYSQKAGEEARGPKKRFWLWRFFDWIWQGWMGFIDVIVRSQPVPEPPPAETTCPEPPQAEVPRVSRAWTSASGAPVLVVASSLDSHRPSAAVKEEIQ